MIDRSIVPEYPSRECNYVLLVEKDPLQRYLLQVSLIEAGWAVRVAEGPAAALRCCEDDFFDVAIVDSHYSDGFSGWALARQFRQEYGLPSLMITSSRIVELETSSDYRKEQELLFKPYRLKECRQRLSKILAHQQPWGKHSLNLRQQLV